MQSVQDRICNAHSLVEGEHPVWETSPEGTNTPQSPETSMVFVNPSDQSLMSTVAEWCICWHFAVAKLVVAWFRDVERNWSAACQDPLALTITEGWVLCVTAWAPIVHLGTVQVNVGWEQTSESWKRRWSIFTLFIRTILSQVNNFLLWEVSDIIHCDLISCLLRRLYIFMRIDIKLPSKEQALESRYLFHELSIHIQLD